MNRRRLLDDHVTLEVKLNTYGVAVMNNIAFNKTSDPDKHKCKYS